MSSNLTETGPINLAENAPAIAPSKACKGSNTLSKLNPPQDEYKGLNWDCVKRYQQLYQDLLRTPSFI